MKQQNLTKLRICASGAPQHKELKKLDNHKLKAAFMQKFLWPIGSEIKICFMSQPPHNIERKNVEEIKREETVELEMDPLQKEVDNMGSVIEAIKKIVKERIEPIVNLKLSFTEDIKSSNIRITFDPDGGAWSYVGTDSANYKGKPTMNLGWFDVATTMHEFGHALGMIHEHQNPNGNPIKWNVNAVYDWAAETQGWDKETTNTNILDMPMEQINGSEFDPYSIMLYFYPASLTLNNKGTHENLRLSPEDVIFLAKMYPKSPQPVDKFYKQVYGENINVVLKDERQNDIVTTTPSNISSEGSTSIYVYIIIGIIILFAIILIFVL